MSESFTSLTQRIASILRQRTRLLVVAVLTLVGFLSAAAPALAVTPGDGDFTTKGVHLRTSPHLSATTLGNGNPGDGAYVHYSTALGDWVNCGGGVRTPVWNWVTDKRTGVTGWASDCFVRTQPHLPTWPQ